MQSSESPARPPLSRSPSKSPDSAFRRNTEAELAEAQNWRRQADARQSAAAAWLRRSMASTAPEPFLSEGQPQMEPAEAGSDETTPHDSSTNGHSSVLGDGEGATAARAAGSPLGVSFVDLPADSTKEEAAEQPLRTLMTRVEHLLFMANEWAYDTIALGEVWPLVLRTDCTYHLSVQLQHAIFTSDCPFCQEPGFLVAVMNPFQAPQNRAIVPDM